MRECGIKYFTNSLIQLIVDDGTPPWRFLILDLIVSTIRIKSYGSRLRSGERVRICVFRVGGWDVEYSGSVGIGDGLYPTNTCR